MDLVYLLKAAVLGVVEGLTEFLPVSSTGHLILAGDWLNFDDGSGKVFEVVIQLGAILAVCWLFGAFLPSVVSGLLFLKAIKAYLFKPVIVAITLMIGGVIILWVEDRQAAASTTETAERITWRQALIVGVAQVVSMIPGTSRSGATIIGGMLGGMSRSAATDFSFFLAIPTMLGATVLDLAKNGSALTETGAAGIAVGFVTAFVSAVIVIKFLIHFVAHHTLRVFAWYRIAFGTVMFAWYGLLPLIAG